jgi:hypothetical protein
MEVFMKHSSWFRKGGENVAGVPVRHQIETWTCDDDISAFYPYVDGWSRSILEKVSIYTVDMEQFFWLSAVVSMSFFISQIECQNSLKILQKKQGSHCNGGILFQQEATDNVND